MGRRIYTALIITLAFLFYGCSGDKEDSTFNFVIGMIFLGIIAFPVLKRVLKDKVENSVHLENSPLATELRTCVVTLNDSLFDNQGKITIINKSKFTLHKVGSNHIIQFKYNIYGLIVVWKYKEVVKEYNYPHIHIQNPLSTREQMILAENILYNIRTDIEKFEKEGITIETFNR